MQKCWKIAAYEIKRIVEKQIWELKHALVKQKDLYHLNLLLYSYFG